MEDQGVAATEQAKPGVRLSLRLGPDEDLSEVLRQVVRVEVRDIDRVDHRTSSYLPGGEIGQDLTTSQSFQHQDFVVQKFIYYSKWARPSSCSR